MPATSVISGRVLTRSVCFVTKYLQIEVCEDRMSDLIEHQIGKWVPMASVIS